MSCSIHRLIDTIKECRGCFDSWPVKHKSHYTRKQCKDQHWIGKVDESRYNEKAVNPQIPTVIDRNAADPEPTIQSRRVRPTRR